MLKARIDELKQSMLFQNSMKLIFGTVLAQLIPIALQPLLRRQFSPEEFGLLALFLTLVGMLLPLANLKYDSAIVLPEEDKEASQLVVGSVVYGLVFSVVIFVLLWVFEANWMKVLHLKHDQKWIFYFVPLSLFLVSGFQSFNYFLIRKKAFNASARNKVYRRSSEGIVQVVLGFLKLPKGLFLGSLVGDLINFFGGIIQMSRVGFDCKQSKGGVLNAMKAYWAFPIYHAIPSCLNAVSLLLPVVIVNTHFSLAETGQFDLSRMVLALPLALISIALSQVYLQHQAEKIRNKQTILESFSKVSLILALLSIPLAGILFLFSDELFKFIFGSDWKVAGELTALLAFSYAVKFIVSPLSATLIALKEVKFSALWQMAYFCMVAWLFYNPGKNLFEFAYRYFVIDVMAYLAYFVLIYGVILRYESQRK